MTVLQDIVMEPKAYLAVELEQGQVLRIEDLEGTQTADVVCFNRHDFDERYSPQNTVTVNRHIHLGKGRILYSTLCKPMFTIVEDTVGQHDLINGMCSPQLNYVHYGERSVGTRTCQDNLTDALAPYGIRTVDIPYPFNTFMGYPVSAEGEITRGATLSKPGDFIDLRAELDLLVGISNCPQDLSEVNGFRSTRLRVAVLEGVEATPA